MDLMLHNVKLYDFMPQPINCAAICKSSGLLAVGLANGEIDIFSSSEYFYQIGVIPGALTNSVEALEWIDGRLFATGLSGFVYEVCLKDWNIKTRLPVVGESVLSMTSRDNSLAVGTTEGLISILRVEETVEVERALPKVDGRILSLAWSESDPYLLASGSEGLLFIWNLQKSHVTNKFEFARDHKKKTLVWDMKFSRDVLVTGDSRGYVCMWDPYRCGLLQQFHSHQADILVIGVSPERDLIYAAGADSIIKVFTRHNSNSAMSNHRKRSHRGTFTEHGTSSNRSEWVTTGSFSGLERDVRAIVVAGDVIICGGSDSQLMVIQKGRQRRKLSPLPQRQLVQVTDREKTLQCPLMMCQYPDYLELFLLGKTQLPDMTVTAHKPRNGLPAEASIKLPNNSDLPLEKNCTRLAKIFPRNNYPISMAQISRCGQYVAYSDTFNTRVLRLIYSKLLNPDKMMGAFQKNCRVIMHRLKFYANSPSNSSRSSRTRTSSMGSTDETNQSTDSRDSDNQSDIWESTLPPAHQLEFCPVQHNKNGGGQTSREGSLEPSASLEQSEDTRPTLFLATGRQVMQCDLTTGEILWTFAPGVADDNPSQTHMLKCSPNGELLAVACHDTSVSIYSVKDQQRLFNCAKRGNGLSRAHPTAMTFSPTVQHIFIAYSNKEFHHINLTTRKTAVSCARYNKSIEQEWRTGSHIVSASFLSSSIVVMNNDTHLLFFNTDSNAINPKFYTTSFDCAPIEESRLIPDYSQSKSLSISNETRKSIQSTSRYQHIVYACAMNNKELLVVNMPPDNLEALLPAPLAKKVFGV